MRVGIDFRPVTAAPLSGVARQALAMQTTLQQRPNTEVVANTAAPADHPHRAIAQCPASPSPVNGLHRLPQRLKFEWGFLPDAISAQQLDVYVATINMGLPIGYDKRQRHAARLVLQLHDVFQLTLRNSHASRLREWFYRWSDRLCIAHAVKVADAIWVPSRHTADSLVALFPQAHSRVRVLPNAVPFAPWQSDEAPRVPAGLPSRYWLVVGTREPRKNVRWFVRVWQATRGQGPGQLPDLVLVGHPEDVPDAPDGVHFVHGLSDAQLRDLYRAAERLWHPSYAEGFGLPVVEAAACGTPVAVALGTSLDEVTPPWAPRFAPDDAERLGDLMLALAQAQRRPDESEAACRDWARRFDWPAYAARLDALLRELA